MRKRTAGLLALIMILICTVSIADGSIAVGNTVTFGKYPQKMINYTVPADPEPIVWRVLAVDGGKALLLSEELLVGMPYNSADHFQYEVTWENCSLRAWLNGDFLNDAFSAGEQAAILQTTVSTPDYVNYNGFTVSGGNDTTDQVFLLTTEEAETYLPEKSSRIGCPTDYAVFTGAGNSWYTYETDDKSKKKSEAKDVGAWWLRSPGAIGHYTALCTYQGEIDYRGEYSGATVLCARPAIWVRIDALAP